MKPPEVSVVMSIYDDERYLKKSVESILSQNGVDFEFLVVNDGSRDGSREILSDYAKRDSRIRIIDQTNAGLTSALIKGCSEARGRYIARQDADDISLPGRLKRLFEMLEDDERLVFVSSWADVIGPEDELLLTYERPADPDVATQQVLHERIGPPGHGSVMFRKDAYEKAGGYREQLYYAQDSDLWLRLGLLGKISYAQEVLYRYRITETSMSGSRHYAKLPYAQLVDELHKIRLAGRNEEDLLTKADHFIAQRLGQTRRSSDDQTLYFIGRCLHARHDRRAKKYLLRCVRSRPLHVKAWMCLISSLIQSPSGGEVRK